MSRHAKAWHGMPGHAMACLGTLRGAWASLGMPGHVFLSCILVLCSCPRFLSSIIVLYSCPVCLSCILVLYSYPLSLTSLLAE